MIVRTRTFLVVYKDKNYSNPEEFTNLQDARDRLKDLRSKGFKVYGSEKCEGRIILS